MAAGVIVAVDVGTVRVGVAASDPHRILASPVVVLKRDIKKNTDVDQLAAIVAEREAVEVVVGLPTGLKGQQGASVTMARTYAELLAQRIGAVPIRLVDERLTTTLALRQLRESGVNARAAKAVIDAAAAVALLQGVLDGG